MPAGLSTVHIGQTVWTRRQPHFDRPEQAEVTWLPDGPIGERTIVGLTCEGEPQHYNFVFNTYATQDAAFADRLIR
jgi:hypothetical protein